MMKKPSIIISTLVLATMLGFSLSACTIPEGNPIDNLLHNNIEKDTHHKVRVADAALYSDNGYIDYASKVFFDTEKYPLLKKQGLFWTKWDNDTKKIVEVAADSPEGAALVDASKPTMISVHGMMNDGNVSFENYWLGGIVENKTDFGQPSDHALSLTKMWLDAGYNVANFKYEKFSYEPSSPPDIEEKIWGTNGRCGMRFGKPDGSYETAVSEYSLAEHFAASYIRALALLPDSIATQEIRVAAHSMGGELASAGLFLLTELAEVGQIPRNKLPVRFAMLDTYFSVNFIVDGKVINYGPKNININWSGKRLVGNNAGFTTIEAIKGCSANGIAIEYYTYKESALRAVLTPTMLSTFKSLCTYSILRPVAESYTSAFNPLTSGHVAVRDWYFCSIYAEKPPLDVTNSAPLFAPSAKMSTKDILKLKGTEYSMAGGNVTIVAKDDTFTRVASERNEWIIMRNELDLKYIGT